MNNLVVPTSSHAFVNSTLGNCNNRLVDLIFGSNPSVTDVSKIDPLALPEDSFYPTLKLIFDLPGLVQTFLP